MEGRKCNSSKSFRVVRTTSIANEGEEIHRTGLQRMVMFLNYNTKGLAI